MVSNRVLTALRGPQRLKVSRLVGAALFVFLTSTVLFMTVPTFRSPYDSSLHETLASIHLTIWWEGYAIGLIVVIALITIKMESLLVAWTFSYAAGAGLGINRGGIAITDGIGNPGFTLLWTFLLGAIIALTFGTIGYLLGISIKQTITSGNT